MSEKRFQPMRVVDNMVMIYDSKTDDVLKINNIANKLNELAEENDQLQQKLKDIYSFKGSNCRCVKYE